MVPGMADDGTSNDEELEEKLGDIQWILESI